MKKRVKPMETVPYELEILHEETREYLKKEYTVSYPYKDEETAACGEDMDKAWEAGERTPVDDWEKLLEDWNIT